MAGTLALTLMAAIAQADTLVEGPYTSNGFQPIAVSLAVPPLPGGIAQLRRVAVQVVETSNYSATVVVPPASPPTAVSISYTSTLGLTVDGLAFFMAPGATWAGIATTGFNNNTGFASGSAAAANSNETRARSLLQAFAGNSDASIGLQLSGAASCSATCNVGATSSLATTVTYEYAPDGLFFDTFD